MAQSDSRVAKRSLQVQPALLKPMAMMKMNFCRSRQPGSDYPDIQYAKDVLSALEAGAPDILMLVWGAGAVISEDCVRLFAPSSQQSAKQAFPGQIPTKLTVALTLLN